MARTFSSNVALENAMQSAATKAVETTCNRLLGTLQEYIISEYYDLFTPDQYRRTYQFFESAMMQMINKNMGEIFMNSDAMNYGEYWDGITQLYMSNAGYHGSVDIYENGHFWNKFIEYCNKNAISILKQELKNNGLNVI